MATHSSVLAWRIPGMEEPGGLPSMGSHRVGHNRSDLAAAANHINIRELGSIHPMRLFPEHFWDYVCIQDSFTASAHPSSSKALFNTTCGWVISPGLSLKYRGINKLWILIGAWTLQMIPVYFRVERSYFSCGGWRSFCGGARLWNCWHWRVALLWRGEVAF